jgi:hypothetical protein
MVQQHTMKGLDVIRVKSIIFKLGTQHSYIVLPSFIKSIRGDFPNGACNLDLPEPG